MSIDHAEGVLSLHPRGFGFVQPTTHSFEIFIPKRFIEDAIDGDFVQVEFNKEMPSKKGYEGKITKVLDRKRKQLTCFVVDKKGKKKVIGYSHILGEDQELVIKKAPSQLKIGDRLLVTLTSYGKKNKAPTATFIKKLGPLKDPSIDNYVASVDYFIPQQFPSNVIEEAQAFGKIVKKADQKDRKDLSHLDTITIDPKTAKDFDDALTISYEDGCYHLLVHIADVSHYVKPDSAIDLEAKKRGNSTYLPGECLPMLPEELSNHLCSLKPNVKRLAVTVDMQIDKEGEINNYTIYRSVIKSKKRFSYEEAKEVLDGKRKSPFTKDLKLMTQLCALFKKKRKERGCIDFALPDFNLKLDKQGNPKGFELIEYDITHQMVEEFMLKANEIVASHLLQKGKKTIFRVHESPSEDKLRAFHAYIRRLGFTLPDEPSSEQLQHIFEQMKSRPENHLLSVQFIKSMKLAYYSEENVGHFGLNLENYLHFTSPIRRYSDFVVHRVLFGEEIEDLSEIATHISNTERNSFKAESSSLQLKKYRLLEKFFDKDPYAIYDGVITQCKPFGIYFELKNFFLEGFIHISQLGNDYYVFYPKTEVIEGEKTKQRFTIGQNIRIEIESIDLVYQQCEFTLSKK